MSVYCDPEGLAISKSITCDNAKQSGANYPLDTGVSNVRPSTLERTQSACNSVAVGKDFNSVGLARGKCAENYAKRTPVPLRGLSRNHCQQGTGNG